MTEKPTRNYKKEYKTFKDGYKYMAFKLPKDRAEAFIKKLDGKPYGQFIKEKIDEFLNE